MDGIQADKWVRIMCDYSADGVWRKDGAGTSAEELPISSALLARLRAWQETYERLDPVFPEGRDLTAEIAAFSEDGRQIARAVKWELPDWTIVYFDEERSGSHIPREVFEYEIK